MNDNVIDISKYRTDFRILADIVAREDMSIAELIELELGGPLLREALEILQQAKKGY